MECQIWGMHFFHEAFVQVTFFPGGRLFLTQSLETKRTKKCKSYVTLCKTSTQKPKKVIFNILQYFS